MKISRLAASLFALLTCATAQAAWVNTPPQLIEQINYNGEADVAYFYSSAKWQAAGCPNAIYVQIKPTIPGRKQMLALAMTAHASGKTVSFLGDCDADQNYFNASYVIVR